MEKLSLSDRISRAIKQYPNDPLRLAQELKKLLRVAEREKDVYNIGKLNLNLAICIFHQGRRDSIIPYAYKASPCFAPIGTIVSRQGAGYVILRPNHQPRRRAIRHLVARYDVLIRYCSRI